MAISCGRASTASWRAKSTPSPPRSAQRSAVVGQRKGRQRALADDHGADELDRDVLGIGGPDAVAEGQQPPALMKTPRHGAAGLGGEERLGHRDTLRKARRDDLKHLCLISLRRH
jgi:hypothetical protein